MPKLKGAHFEWLATEIAADIQPRKLDSFIRKVRLFSQNNRFNENLFRNRCADTLQANEYDDGLDPKLYQGRY